MKRILVLAKYGDRAASTRQRLLGMRPYLEAQGLQMDYQPFFSNDYLERLNHGLRQSPLAIAKAYMQRVAFLLKQHRHYDAFWIHCELLPYMPGWCDALLAKAGKPVFMEFDDAIFHQYDAHPRPLVRRLLAGKLAPLLRKTTLAICGNSYIHDYCSRFCESIIIPTVVDSKHYQPREAPKADSAPLTLGWIGSPSTWEYCQPLLPMLEAFAAQDTQQMLAVGAESRAPEHSGITFKSWRKEEEASDIQAMDIGIMPLRDDVWARGKCGYKLIQYMACGLPVIASPVGVNCDIVTHGENGFLASNNEEWQRAIATLSADANLRARMGRQGRETMQAHYCFAAIGPKLARAAAAALA